MSQIKEDISKKKKKQLICQQYIFVVSPTEFLTLDIVYDRSICLCICNQNETSLIQNLFEFVNKELNKTLGCHNVQSFYPPPLFTLYK